MEDTGLGRHVPVGLGLLTYTDLESAVQCLEAVQRDYARHAVAACEFAREHLDSDRVLTRILALARV
jgi:6,7-dimethyl-8-ribityllumazine synthase